MKKYLIIFICSILILISSSCNGAEDMINPTPQFYEYDELLELFYNNADDFQQIADILLESEKLYESMCKNERTHYDIAYTWQYRFFEESEWSFMCNFLKNTGLKGFTRYEPGKKAGNGTVCFYTIRKCEYGFFHKRYIRISLFYSNIKDLSKTESRDYKKITGYDGWYVYEKTI